MYFILVSSLIAGFGAQIVKILLEAVQGKFSWKRIWEYGGMPSSHTSFVSSLTTAIALSQGLSSPAFAIALIFSILTIRDSVGLRRQAGLHGRAIEVIMKHYPKEAGEFKNVVHRLGHTPLEAAAGIVFGFFVVLVFFWYGR